jgi:hypothetical protein
MSSLLEMVASQLQGGNLDQISQALGVDAGTAQQAVNAALPALLGGLAKNASTPDGAQSLASALDRDHDGSMLDNVGGLLGGLLGGGGGQGGGLGSLLGMATEMLGGASAVNPRAANGDGILGHIFGDRRGNVEQGIAKASGLDLGQIAKLLPILAPMVMAALGKTKRQQGLDAGGVAEMLGQQRASVQQQGGLGGLLNLIDLDGDGNALEEITQIGGGLLGSLFGGKR